MFLIDLARVSHGIFHNTDSPVVNLFKYKIAVIEKSKIIYMIYRFEKKFKHTGAVLDCIQESEQLGVVTDKSTNCF